MKKFWEKHSLIKLALLMIAFTILLTWVVPQGYFDSELVVGEITRVGIFDFFSYSLLSVFYFPVLVTLIFVIGAFYEVLGKTSGYNNLTDAIAKKFKNVEIIFVLITSFIIAALTAVINDYFIVLVFIPFFITILSKLKLDKMTGFATTFGAVLVGILGTIYSNKIVGLNITSMGSDINDYLWVKVVIFASAFILFSIFNVLNVKKNLKNKKAEKVEDMFISETDKKKTKVWPMAVLLVIFTVITLAAYFPWKSVLQTSIFDDIHRWFYEFKIFDAPIFGYILGSRDSFVLNQSSPAAFGNWDLFGIQAFMLITTLILKVANKMNWNEYFTAIGEGFKKVSKLVIVLLVTYTILIFAVMFPVLPTILDWLLGLVSKFNVILATIGGLFTSLFTVEYQYTLNLVGRYFAGSYADFAKQLPIMLQATYGLASFFTPASAILMVGLSYFEVSYKDWFKYIWKFLLAMFVIIVALMLVIF